MTWFSKEGNLSKNEVLDLTRQAADEALIRICRHPVKILLLPPDITRAHSGAGWITEEFYKIFAEHVDVHVIPTLGQHVPHTPEQNKWMFGSIPEKNIHAHDWRDGSKVIGEISAEFPASGGEGHLETLSRFAVPSLRSSRRPLGGTRGAGSAAVHPRIRVHSNGRIPRQFLTHSQCGTLSCCLIVSFFRSSMTFSRKKIVTAIFPRTTIAKSGGNAIFLAKLLDNTFPSWYLAYVWKSNVLSLSLTTYSLWDVPVKMGAVK